MSTAVLLTMALEVAADSDDGESGDVAHDTLALIEEYGINDVLTSLAAAALAAVDAHAQNEAPSTIDRLRRFAEAIAIAKGALS